MGVDYDKRQKQKQWEKRERKKLTKALRCQPYKKRDKIVENIAKELIAYRSKDREQIEALDELAALLESMSVDCI